MRPPKTQQALSRLLRHPQLWRAGQLGETPETISSGFAALDACLPGGGWPRAGLTELLLGTAGIGELRLLMPALRALSREQPRWIVWVAPPFLPYAPALEAGGVDVRRILLIQPASHQEALWALERASRSGTCSLALAWLDERQLTLTDTRRLQLAARQGRTLTCLFRPEQAAALNSLAELRVRMQPAQSGSVLLDICKRRGGWPVQALSVELSAALGSPPGPDDIHQQLALWRQWHHGQHTAATLTHEAPEPSPHRIEAAHGKAPRDGSTPRVVH